MIATVPSWEDPISRFLQGEGELEFTNGVPFCLWEAVLFPESFFPLRVRDTEIRYTAVFEAAYALLSTDDRPDMFVAEQREVERKLFPDPAR